MDQKNNTGKTVAIICGIAAYAIVSLFIIFSGAYMTARAARRFFNEINTESARTFQDFYDDYYDYDNYYDYYPDDYGYSKYEDEYYDTFEDAIRYDLSYQVTFEEYTYRGEFDAFIYLNAVYPVISGGVSYQTDRINEIIYQEIQLIEDGLLRHAPNLGRDETYFFSITCYVTYMDENTLSVIYSEEGESGSFGEVYLVSLNIDMETGMIIDNTGLLNINDEFSIEFRNRSDRQNGTVSYLSSLTDQDITYFLNDRDYLIVFYTPLGMEVGFQYPEGYGWVTVTYKDYMNYRKLY